ncbi:hypothetical protein Hesp01_74300 [Herbidospora sp. NBRC 101105]|nr:hypothetical protein Hesp01_74300 [Herbidospora sp. NBRC 101105]
MLPMAGWDTEAFLRLRQWVANRLAQDYSALSAPDLPPGMSEKLAVRGHILPVLDGLSPVLHQAASWRSTRPRPTPTS